MFSFMIITTLLVGVTGAVNYVGCFDDPTNTDVPGVSISNKSLKKCIKFCMSEDYMFTSNLHSTGCYCGESFGAEGFLPRGRCYAYCSGTTPEECVGKFTNTVWYTNRRKEDSSSDSSDSDESDDAHKSRSQSGDTVKQQLDGDAAKRQPRGANAEQLSGGTTVYFGEYGMGMMGNG